MLQPDRIFGNFFENKEITPLRLSNFAVDAISRFENVDKDGSYKDTINEITTANLNFFGSLSAVDKSLKVKKGKTKTVHDVMQAFVTFMREYESEIAHKLGGFKSAAYSSFYPNGVTGFTKATKTQMPLLVNRVYSLAADHATALGDELTRQLQGFVASWTAALNEQSGVLSTINKSRGGRSGEQLLLELALLKAIHRIGEKYPGNVTAASAFFDFTRLTGATHKAHPDNPTPAAGN